VDSTSFSFLLPDTIGHILNFYGIFLPLVASTYVLGLVEELAALSHFQHKCAYCYERVYEVLEHYIPPHRQEQQLRTVSLPASVAIPGGKAFLPIHWEHSFPLRILNGSRLILSPSKMRKLDTSPTMA
jgi:hypothetical protein